jgi:hypothetical protein
MRHRFLLAAQVILLVVGSSFAGALTGGVFPTLPGTAALAAAPDTRAVALLSPASSDLTYQGRPDPKGYHNVLVVSPSGGDYTSIQDALDSITDSSADNTYLIWVGPGTYTERVAMKQYVDIQGAGEGVTRITFAGDASTGAATLMGASHAQLRFLTVENTGGEHSAIAIKNGPDGPVTASLLHVTAIASGGAYNCGVCNDTDSRPTMTNVTVSASGGTDACGVCNFLARPTMTDVTVSVSGGTRYNIGVSIGYSSEATMKDVTVSASGGITSTGVGIYGDLQTTSYASIYDTNISAGGASTSYGVYNYNSVTQIYNINISAGVGIYNRALGSPPNSRLAINHSTVTASANTVINTNRGEGSSVWVQVGATLLAGGPVLVNGGRVTCANVHDENYKFYPNDCP